MSSFLVNCPLQKKQFFRVRLLVGLGCQVFNSWTMYKIKIKSLYIEEKLFWTEKEWLNIKVTLPLAKLGMVGSRLVSNGLIFPGGNPVDIQLVFF